MNKEEMRKGFEAWHCEQYKTKHTTGAPTRDMHGGVRDENYGPPKQQALWECWQETGGDVAKVEALKDEIERVEAGKEPVAQVITHQSRDMAKVSVQNVKLLRSVPHGTMLYTRSDAGEVERLWGELESHKEALREEMQDAFKFQQRALVAEQRNAAMDIEAAAKKLAACMDYPWEHMPEQGRSSMREHAKAVIDAALSASTAPTNKECAQ